MIVTLFLQTPGYVSTVAGALWEYPPAVCGRHRNEVSIARSKDWAMDTYNFMKTIAQLPGDHGVGMKNTIFYTK
jgi:D-amino-acid oxidase